MQLPASGFYPKEVHDFYVNQGYDREYIRSNIFQTIFGARRTLHEMIEFCDQQLRRSQERNKDYFTIVNLVLTHEGLKDFYHLIPQFFNQYDFILEPDQLDRHTVRFAYRPPHSSNLSLPKHHLPKPQPFGGIRNDTKYTPPKEPTPSTHDDLWLF